MSYSGLLENKISIFRPTVTYLKGRPTKTYVAGDTDVPCNIQYITGKALTPAVHGYEDVEGWRIFFEYDADIQKDDKLTDERGRVFIVQSAPIDVTGRKHHIECLVDVQE
uniref:Head-tail joining protein n=1 Tax=viral metagenome TaxID=1070528 RepID=A0A6M3M7X1_9ZZZZ